MQKLELPITFMDFAMAAATGKEATAVGSSDIRVTSVGKVRSFVADALAALPNGAVKLHAQGPAVSKAVTVAEIAKRRLRGLHQNTQIGLAEPAEEGAASQPAISIVLSLQPLDPSRPGYQPPLTDEEMLDAGVDLEEPDGIVEDGAASSAPPPTAAASAATSSFGSKRSRAASSDDEPAVVFLDIDGVLLPFGPGVSAAPADPARQFPSRCLGALSRLLEVSGARLVLSSTWRAVPAAREQIVANFARFAAEEPTRGAALGAVARFDEMTDPAYHAERQWEIHAWLQAHPAVRRWVALDDEELLLGAPNAERRGAFERHAVKTESHVGLTDELTEAAIALLAAQEGET